MFIFSFKIYISSYTLACFSGWCELKRRFCSVRVGFLYTSTLKCSPVFIDVCWTVQEGRPIILHILKCDPDVVLSGFDVYCGHGYSHSHDVSGYTDKHCPSLVWDELTSSLKTPLHISELVCDSLNMYLPHMCVFRCVCFRYFTAWSVVWRGHLPSQQDVNWFCAVKTSGSSRFSSHMRGTVLISMPHCSGCHDQVRWKITVKVNLWLFNNVLQMCIWFLLPW